MRENSRHAGHARLLLARRRRIAHQACGQGHGSLVRHRRVGAAVLSICIHTPSRCCRRVRVSSFVCCAAVGIGIRSFSSGLAVSSCTRSMGLRSCCRAGLVIVWWSASFLWSSTWVRQCCPRCIGGVSFDAAKPNAAPARWCCCIAKWPPPRTSSIDGLPNAHLRVVTRLCVGLEGTGMSPVAHHRRHECLPHRKRAGKPAPTGLADT